MPPRLTIALAAGLLLAGSGAGSAEAARAGTLSSAAEAAAKPHTISFYVGLRRPEAAARAAFAAVSDPGSPSYRRFSGSDAVARRYGASAATVAGLRRAARRHGLRLSVDRSRVFARLTAPVPRLERAFGVRVVHSYDNDTLSFGWTIAGGRAPRPARDLRPWIGEVVASYTRSQRRAPGAAAAGSPPVGAGARPPAPGNAGTWTGGCAAAEATGAYSFGQVRSAYGLDALGPAPGGVGRSRSSTSARGSRPRTSPSARAASGCRRCAPARC